MNVCRFGYKRPDGKCVLNGNKCRTTCGSIVEVEPPTVKDVLLKTWAQDTEAMAMEHIYKKTFQGLDSYVVRHAKQSFSRLEDAVAAEVAYLNSAAEVGK